MFGISKLDLTIANDKIKAQREYMQNFSFINALGEVKSLLDISMSANLSKRYYAEVSNRINTLNSFSIMYQQKGVFLTITLNGCFRGALKGEYDKFKPLDWKYIPSDIKSRMKNGESLEIRDLVQILNYQWLLLIKRFQFKFKNIDRSYVRCFEPHKKDGVPHIHALFYLPAHTIPYLFECYKDLFNAPQNLKTDAITPHQARNGEINGFQWTIDNPTGYVMKYIQKTFMNLSETDELDDLAAWYVKHKIRRFITSRTQVPLWVYRRINFISSMRDFYHLCDIKNDDENVIEWDLHEKYINIFIPRRDEQVTLENGVLIHKIAGRVIDIYETQKLPKKSSQSIKPDLDAWVDAWYVREGEKIRRESMKNKGETPKFPSQMSKFELYNYYSKLDKAECNIQHLAYIENLMLERDLSCFTKKDTKHDLNAPELEDFIERGLREYEF